MAREESLRIAIVTHYFPPEVGAAASRLIELAQRFRDGGNEVTVLTGLPNYPTGVIPARYRGRLRMADEVGGVRVLRGWILPAPNRGFLRRVLNHVSLTVAVLLNAKRAGPIDVVFVQSPPLFAGLAGLALRRLKRAPFVFNVSDIWPESAVQMGALKNRLAIRLAEAVERHLYREARRITVATPGMVARLAARGIALDKLVLLRNGVDTDSYRPLARDEALGRRLDLDDGRQVFLYAGNHGMAQGLGVILDAAALVKSHRVLFQFVGDGADKAALEASARARGLDNVRFAPSLPKEEMPALLNLAYAAVIPLRALELFRSAVPSKLFEAMAVGRPIVAALWGEAASLIESARCGVVVPPEDGAALAAAVDRLAGDAALAAELGEHGREYVVANFDRKEIARHLADVLRETARSRPRPLMRV